MCQRVYPQPSESATRAGEPGGEKPKGEFGIWHIKVVPINPGRKKKAGGIAIATQAQRQFNTAEPDQRTK